MKTFREEDMLGGWFVGDFVPSAFRTDTAEVCLKRHKKDEQWPTHYHAVAVEINLVVEGELTINERRFGPGDGFVIECGEVAEPRFLTDCCLVVVKVPSVPGDKYIIDGGQA
ncbi:hypothetical protein GCM10022419_131010 [Nonomuraea rosea]|uniref:Cupin domain-containing protein n=1 Tax=Nonomuraea rosea TaxID=638574 RepID=A0ABP7A104_9ACTN